MILTTEQQKWPEWWQDRRWKWSSQHNQWLIVPPCGRQWAVHRDTRRRARRRVISPTWWIGTLCNIVPVSLKSKGICGVCDTHQYFSVRLLFNRLTGLLWLNPPVSAIKNTSTWQIFTYFVHLFLHVPYFWYNLFGVTVWVTAIIVPLHTSTSTRISAVLEFRLFWGFGFDSPLTVFTCALSLWGQRSLSLPEKGYVGCSLAAEGWGSPLIRDWPRESIASNRLLLLKYSAGPLSSSFL